MFCTGSCAGGTRRGWTLLAEASAVLTAAYLAAAHGPRSLRGQYRRQVGAALRAAPVANPHDVVSEADLAPLPPLVADYVRRSGAVGRPRIGSIHARLRGRIRAGEDQPWMPFTAEQVNTYGLWPRRVFFMSARRSGLPVDVLHVYTAAGARMRARVLSLVDVVDASGPEMDRAETVTVLNDLCVLAPPALVDAPIAWETLDDLRVRATMTGPGFVVSAVLVFDGQHDLVDFVSDDRLRASSDGARFTPERWSTPVSGHSVRRGRRVVRYAEAHWHPPEGELVYLEVEVDDVSYC